MGGFAPPPAGAHGAAGISNYSIFRHGLTLFGYFETDDIERTREYLANDETNRRWSEWMDPIMKVDIDPTTDFPYLLPLQWHMDGSSLNRLPAALTTDAHPVYS
jgi:L-rhamnose mutarotase